MNARNRPLPARATAAVGAVLFLIAGVLVGSPLSIFVDLPRMLLVLGGASLAWGLLSGDALLRLPQVLRADRPSEVHLKEAGLTLEEGRRALWSVAVLGMVLGAGHAMVHLQDYADLGPALALNLLAVVYAGLSDGLVFLPLRAAVDRRRAEALEAPPVARALRSDLAASMAALHKLKAARRNRT